MGLSSIDSSIEIFKSILDSGDQNLVKEKGGSKVEELEKVLPLIGGVLGTIARVGAGLGAAARAAPLAAAGAGALTDDGGDEQGGQPPPLIYPVVD